MSKLTELPYAQWLEQSLRNIIDLPVEAICIITKMEDGEVGTGYWNTSMADKLVFSGIINQDAMLETLRVNGFIEDEEDEDEDEQEEQEFA